MADTLLSHHVGRGRRGLVRLQWSCILATSGRGSVGPSGRSPIPSCRRPSISSSWQRLARRAVHHSEHKERKGNITPNCFAVAQKIRLLSLHYLTSGVLYLEFQALGPFLSRYSVAAEVLLNLTK